MNSHAVGPVVLMGASQHAVPPVRFLLDVLEEVRRPEDAEQSRRPRGEDLPQSGKQRKNLNQIGCSVCVCGRGVTWHGRGSFV